MNNSAQALHVVVCVVNWNTAALTLKCLHSVYAMTYPNFSVAVIDNASRDDSVAQILENFPLTALIRSTENLGFAAGHALGLRHAQSQGAQAVWLLNSDTVVEIDALDWLVNAWRTHGDALYGGIALVESDEGCARIDFPAKFLGEASAPRAFERDRPIFFDQEWRVREAFRVGAVVGSSMLVPIALVSRLGWMDTAWFMYCEEIDYCFRARQVGVERFLVPHSRVWHVGGASHASNAGVGNCIAYYRTRNEIELTRRHGARYVWLCVVAKKLFRAAANLAVSPARARMTLAGVADAVRGRMGKTYSPEDFLERAR